MDKQHKQINENLDFLDALLADLQNSTPQRSNKGSSISIKDEFLLPQAKQEKVNTSNTKRTVGGPTFTSSNGASASSVEALLEELDNTVSHSKTTMQNRPVQGRATLTDQTVSKTASSATKELDDLMASLSDFKVNIPASGNTVVVEQSRMERTETEKLPSPPNDEVDYASIDKKPKKPPVPIPSQQQANNLDSMLGSLQSNMSKQGVTTVTKGICGACDKPIIGQVCTALGKTWHPEHFTCYVCDTPLGTQTFFERDGKPFCEEDYHEQFAPKCFACQGPILDSCVTSMDHTWHPEHFVCFECNLPFGDSGFHEKDGKAYCREDYFKMFAPKCSGCNKAIIDNYISALNGHWHPHCFVCMECHQPFQGGSFFEHEGMPYCEMHYHARRGSLCYSCQKPITGRCITAMHRKFHPEHFICAFCLKQLNKGTFKEQNDKPYCHGCFVKLFG
ncbi:paxillin isoform X1 [Hydra vulgaris]|uniref:paxillin isoform X1 n=1 Tax=Hydra vulgaris TaxID=6087 RepID=UPI001F5F2D98|nr:paxillin isoform X1 [Hydra vulgaris]XP_047141671.1 paxillin isoform X1 [Hydra vulgaris]